MRTFLALALYVTGLALELISFPFLLWPGVAIFLGGALLQILGTWVVTRRRS
jgi:hypothetical protein